MPGSTSASHRTGLYATALAFVMWGFFPLYWKLLVQVPAIQIMAHRLVWCAVFVCGYLFATRGLAWVRAFKGQHKLLRTLTLTGLMIALNWGLYIWAVNNGHVIESSLGYFITPLVNVLMGVIVLKERLSTGQKIAFSLAAAGVVWLTIGYGKLPWIALTLAFSFGGYGLLRKITAVDSISGLAVESLILFPVMAALLIYWQLSGHGHLGHDGALTTTLLMLGGLVTAVPLILFAIGAKRIPLATVGLLQYIGPTIQFLCGLLFFHEQFDGTRAAGFIIIWAGCAVYLAESLWRARMPSMLAAVPGE